MRPDERERLYQLCARIEKEKDRRRFLELIEELDELLDRQQFRPEDQPQPLRNGYGMERQRIPTTGGLAVEDGPADWGASGSTIEANSVNAKSITKPHRKVTAR